MLEILTLLQHLFTFYMSCPFVTQILAISFVFVFTVAPKLTFDDCIGQPTLFLGNLALDLLFTASQRTSAAITKSYQQIHTEPSQILNALLNNGHPIIIFLITALAFSVLRQKNLMQQLSNLEKNAARMVSTHGKFQNKLGAQLQQETIAKSKAQKETTMLLKMVKDAKCSRGKGINVSLEEKTITHGCCEDRANLQWKIHSLKVQEQMDKAKMRNQRTEIVQLKKGFMPPSDNAEANHKASLYDEEKAKCEDLRERMVSIEEENERATQTTDLVLDLLAKRDEEIKQLKERLLAAGKKISGHNAMMIVVSNARTAAIDEAVTKSQQKDRKIIDDLNEKIKKIVDEKAASDKNWVDSEWEVREKLAEAEENLEEEQAKSSNLENQITELKREFTKISLESGRFLMENSKLTSEQQGLKQLTSDAEDQVVDLRGQLERANNNYRKLSERFSKDQVKINTLTSESQILLSEKAKTEQEILKLKLELVGLPPIYSPVTDTDHSIGELQQKLAAAEARWASVKDIYVLREDANQHIKSLEDSHAAEKKQAENVFAGVLSQLQGGQACNTDLQNQLAQASSNMETLKNEQKAAISRVQAQAEAAKNEQEKRIAIVQARAESEKHEQKRQIAKMQAQAEAAKNEHKDQIAKVQAHAEAAKNALKRQKEKTAMGPPPTRDQVEVERSHRQAIELKDQLYQAVEQKNALETQLREANSKLEEGKKSWNAMASPNNTQQKSTAEAKKARIDAAQRSKDIIQQILNRKEA